MKGFIMRLRVVLFFAVFSTMAHAHEKAWNEYVIKLQPSDFPELTQAMADTLSKLGCGIPQRALTISPPPFNKIKKGNVLIGQLNDNDVDDIAVLCSQQGRTAVYVFFDNEPEPVFVSSGTEDYICIMAASENGQWRPEYYGQDIRVLSKGKLEKYNRYKEQEYDMDIPRFTHDGLVLSCGNQAEYLYWAEYRWIGIAAIH